jgi:glycosyltransferase involved in cell wall biosynthesis
VWAVQQFKKFAGSRTDVRHVLVGARYTRAYEADYVVKVKAAIDGDPRISLHDVTSDVDQFYAQADVLLFPSLNEVTPMVISEAMSHYIPVITTDIAGIPEMIHDGVEGFTFRPCDSDKCVAAMTMLADDPHLRYRMGVAGRHRFDAAFDLDIMCRAYRRLVFDVAPPTVLVDMDGTAVDWDEGFMQAWGGRSELNRSKSFFIADCTDYDHRYVLAPHVCMSARLRVCCYCYCYCHCH